MLARKQIAGIFFIIVALLVIFAVCNRGPINVKNYGAKGNGIKDDTSAIQNAVDHVYAKGGGIVLIPDGIYLINPDVSIILRNNIKLKLSNNATLKALPSDNENYAILSISDVNNVEIVGGNIIGERFTHTGLTGEWGMGINITGSNNILISDITITDCWGDGIYLGVTPKQDYCENVIVEKFKIDNNRRQGISVISAKNLTIRDGVISDTHGTDPQAGIDLEPNNPTQYLQNIVIENLVTKFNAGHGIDISLSAYFPHGVSVIISNYSDQYSTKGGISENFKKYKENPINNIVINNYIL